MRKYKPIDQVRIGKTYYIPPKEYDKAIVLGFIGRDYAIVRANNEEFTVLLTELHEECE